MCYKREMDDVTHPRWDPRNVAPIARHGVTADEVEQVVRGDVIMRHTYENRRVAIDPLADGRLLAIVPEMTPEGSAYPMTAPPASRQEHHVCDEVKGGSV